MDRCSLAQEKFEAAVFELYRNYMRKNEAQCGRKGSPARAEPRGIADILAKHPPTQPLSDKLAMVVRGFRDVESLLADYSGQITEIVRDKPAQLQFALFWTGEEAVHGFALDEILIACGTNTPREIMTDKAHLLSTCKWDPVKADERFEDPWYGPVCYVTVQEKITAQGYRWLRDRAKEEGQTALALIANRLAGEEARHHAFYLAIAQLALSYKPEKIRESILAVVKDFAMPGRYAFSRTPNETPGPDPTAKSALPNYDNWTAVGQELGIVPDPLYAIPVAARLQRSTRTLDIESYGQDQRRIDCWNCHVNAILTIFRELGGLALPHDLRYLRTIPIPKL